MSRRDVFDDFEFCETGIHDKIDDDEMFEFEHDMGVFVDMYAEALAQNSKGEQK